METEQLKQNIENMKKELAKMEAELAESEKVELKDGGWYIDTFGNIYCIQSIRKAIDNGGTRATKELAEIASKNMVTRNKLEAYVHQIQGYDGGEYTISSRDGDYEVYSRVEKRYPLCTVFMERDTAKKIVQYLRDGRITL